MVGTVALTLVAMMSPAIEADVRTRDKTQIKFEGMLGRMIGMFGGKAAREGIVGTTVVKGDRKATLNESNGQLVDLAEEKVYDIDFKKKEYKVTTFDELRRRMQEARERAEKDAKQQGEETGDPGKELEVDFDVKETGQKKPIAGYDTRQVIMTITLREKGKTLEESGGLVLTSDSWLGPVIPEMKEIVDFEMRYWKQLQGPEAAGMSAEQMAAVLAMYPGLAKAMERMKQEGSKLEGTPLAQTTTFEGVKSKAQMDQQAQSSSGGGLGGMLARRMKKDSSGTPRATIFTITHEVQEVATAVAPEQVALPAGFKEKK
jgi:hypothetical protein